MTFPGNVTRHFLTICQSHARYFTERRVRFAWRNSKNASTYGPFLGTAFKRRRWRCLFRLLFTSLPDQLIDCWHDLLPEVRPRVTQKPWMLQVGWLTCQARKPAI